MRTGLRGFLVAFLILAGFSDSSAAQTGGSRLDGVAVDWSGFYVGGHVGYGWSSVDTDISPPVDVDGWLFGGHVGVQRQFDRWVLGIEGSFSDGELDGRDVVGALDIKASISDLVLVTGRVGYTWRDLLAYVKGGYASAEVGVSGTNSGVPFSESSRRHGWTAGFGIERKLTERISFGIEYNYIDLSGDSFALPAPPVLALVVVAPPKTPTRVDPDDIHTIFARLSFKLGGEPERVPYK